MHISQSRFVTKMSKNLGPVFLYSFLFFLLSFFLFVVVVVVSTLSGYAHMYQAAFTLIVYVFVLATFNGIFLIFVSQLRDKVSLEHMGVSHAALNCFFVAIVLYIFQERELNVMSMVTVGAMPVVFLLSCLPGCFKSSPQNIKIPILATREVFFFSALMLPFFHNIDDNDNALYSMQSVDNFNYYFVVPFSLFSTWFVTFFVVLHTAIFLKIFSKLDWINIWSDCVLSILILVYAILCWIRVGVYDNLSDTLYYTSLIFYVISFLISIFSILKSVFRLISGGADAESNEEEESSSDEKEDNSMENNEGAEDQRQLEPPRPADGQNSAATPFSFLPIHTHPSRSVGAIKIRIKEKGL